MLSAVDGFVFAASLFDKMGLKCDRGKMTKWLREIADGSTTLYNSPEEEAAAMEAERGELFSPEVREDVVRALRDQRYQLEVTDSIIASSVLASFIPPPEAPAAS